MTRWQKELAVANPDEQAKAKAEMRNTTDPAVIPALTWAASAIPSRTPAGRQASIAFQREAVALLGRLPVQRATYVLTQQAVLASSAEVRSAATDELKKRQMYDYVPVLLDGLANPLKFEYSFWFDPSTGVAVYRAVLEQEGPFADKEYLYTNSMSGLQPTQSVTNQGAVSTTRSTKAVAPSKVSVGPVKLDTWSRQNPNATVIAQNRSYAIPAGANPVVNNYWTYAQPAAQQLGRVEMYNGKLLYPTLDETTKKSTISRWNSTGRTQPDNDWQACPRAHKSGLRGRAVRLHDSSQQQLHRGNESADQFRCLESA